MSDRIKTKTVVGLVSLVCAVAGAAAIGCSSVDTTESTESASDKLRTYPTIGTPGEPLPLPGIPGFPRGTRRGISDACWASCNDNVGGKACAGKGFCDDSVDPCVCVKLAK